MFHNYLSITLIFHRSIYIGIQIRFTHEKLSLINALQGHFISLDTAHQMYLSTNKDKSSVLVCTELPTGLQKILDTYGKNWCIIFIYTESVCSDGL